MSRAGQTDAMKHAGAPPRLLFVVSGQWYFLGHRLPMARAARDAGFEVHVATSVPDGGKDIAALGFVPHDIPYARGRLSPWSALTTIRALRRLLREIEPTIAHHVSLQSVVFGLIAARGLPVATVNTITGLGYVFSSDEMKARLVRPFLRAVMRRLINDPRTTTLVENPDDRAALIEQGFAPARLTVFPGSGVDTERLTPTPEPEGPPTVGFVGRLIDNKGIRELLAAHRLLRVQGSNVQLVIAGTPDPENPTSLPEDEARSWNNEPGVRWLGHVSDIAGFWAQSHIAVLPTRGGEGLPVSLLEAAACGRPLIATDVAGCREIAVDGETAILVPVDDAQRLADAIARLASSPELRARYGAAARRRTVERFSAQIVGRDIVALYRRLLERSSRAEAPA